ncbi:MAG: TIGR02300 family protein [Rhodospirillaceae bacterium]|nr:TIGR02300 family protein [Rhodospirillaceae bacterium]
MSKPEWGTKRICQNCNTRFYDFARSPIHCPKCKTIVDPKIQSRTWRPIAKRKATFVENDTIIYDIDKVIEKDISMIDDERDDDENSLIEDTSDLEENNDDMIEVMEHIDDLENEL